MTRRSAIFFLAACGSFLLSACAGPPVLLGSFREGTFPVWSDPDNPYQYEADKGNQAAMTRFAWLEGRSIYVFALGMVSRSVKVKGIGAFLDTCPYQIAMEVVTGEPLPGWFIASPRQLRVAETHDLSLQDPRLIEGLRRFLEGQGLENPQPHIEQAVAADLDGDGDSEAVISAEIDRERDQSDVHFGDYSLVAFGDLSASSFTVIDFYGDIANESIVVRKRKGPSTMSSFRLVAIVDIDFDGRFDLTIGERGYEWGGVDVVLNRDGGLEFYGSAWCGS